MDDYIALTEAEERRLTEELSRNPTFIKLQAVRSVLEAYRAASQPSILTTAIKMFASGPRAGSKAAQIRPLVIDYLTRKGGRAQTAELLDVVTKAGVEIGGQKPVGTMSSYLSNMEELDHRQGEGYGLKQASAETPPLAPPAVSSTDDRRYVYPSYNGGVFGPEYDGGDAGERHADSEPPVERTAEPEILK